jgi:hypothetical protein
MENDDIRYPVWFTMPRRFYERLNAAAEEYGVSRAKLLMRGLELAISEHLKKAGGGEVEESIPTDEAISSAMRSVAKQRWAKATAAERKAMGDRLTAARWKKEKPTKKKTK